MGGRDSCGRKKQSSGENLGKTPRGVLGKIEQFFVHNSFNVKEDLDEHIYCIAAWVIYRKCASKCITSTGFFCRLYF
jgi:hypothetical protein